MNYFSVDSRTIILKGYSDRDLSSHSLNFLVFINLHNNEEKSQKVYKKIKKIREKLPYDGVSLESTESENYWGASSTTHQIVVTILLSAAGNLIYDILKWAVLELKKLKTSEHKTKEELIKTGIKILREYFKRQGKIKDIKSVNGNIFRCILAKKPYYFKIKSMMDGDIIIIKKMAKKQSQYFIRASKKND